jgi:Flp pilus assembly protein TadD
MILPALMLAACATTEKPQPKAQIEIQEAVGFTIIEQVSVSDAVRFEYSEALDQFEHGNHEHGIAMLQAVAADAPNVSGPRIDLGMAYHLAGDLEAAEAELQQALELNPEHPVALNELGIIYRKTGRFAEARQSYEAALAVYPGYHHARRNLGVLCDLYLGDLECALQAYEAYMTTVQSDAEATMWIADIRNRLGRQE